MHDNSPDNGKNGRRWLWALVACFLVAAPFLIINLWNHPGSDDFWLALEGKGKSILAGTVDFYKTWSGRYFSVFLSIGGPTRLGLSAHAVTPEVVAVYRVVSFLMVSLFLFCVWFFISSVNKYLLKLRRLELFVLYTIIVAAMLATIASPEEFFYWYAGAVAYCVPLCLYLLSAGLYVRYLHAKRIRWLCLAGLSVLLVLQVGAVETQLMLTMATLAGLNLYHLVKRRRLDPAAAFLLALGLVFSLVSVLAPGNFVRKAGIVEGVESLRLPFLNRFATWSATAVSAFASFSWKPLIFVILSLPFLYRGADGFARRKPASPLWSFGGLLVGWVLVILPLLAGGGRSAYGALRVRDWLQIVLILGYEIVAFHTLWYLRYRAGGESGVSPLDAIPETARRYLRRVWVILAAGTLVWSLTSIDSNIFVAWFDVAGGPARSFDRQEKARYELIEKSDSPALVVPPITNVPKTIYHGDVMTAIDLKGDQVDIQRLAYSKYWGKERITRSSYGGEDVLSKYNANLLPLILWK